MRSYLASRLPGRMSAVLLAGCLAGAPIALAEVVYRESFPSHRDPTRYLRIAQGAEDWEIVEEDGARILRVTIRPSEDQRQALVVWDLAPLSFQELSIEIRPDLPGLAFSAAANDRFGTSYIFKPLGRERGGNQRNVLAPGVWNRYAISLPEDIQRIRERGREVAPFLHAPGEDVKAWESIDFTNRGFKTLFFHVIWPKDIPLPKSPFTVDFRLLELRSLGR